MDRTKKLVVIMIISIVIAVPVSWHVAPLLSNSITNFRVVGYVTIIIAALFLANRGAAVAFAFEMNTSSQAIQRITEKDRRKTGF